jgi:Tol biopolymer transport system component
MNLVRRCLDKSPERRLQSARDLALVLANEVSGNGLSEPNASSSSAIDASNRPPSRRRLRLAWSVALLALLGMGAALAWQWFRLTPPVEHPEARLDVVTAPTPDPIARLSIALSPDGQKIVFVAPQAGTNQLWLRAMSSAIATPLKGTDGASYPFWKPDGQSIGFFAKGMLSRIDLAGGAVQELAPANAGRGGAWSQDGTIVFTPGNIDPLYRIPDSGGTPIEVTHIVPQRQASHRFPQFLPDGRHILFYANGDDGGVYVADLASGKASRLAETDTAAVLGSDSHLLFIKRGTLYGIRFNQERNVVEGDPFRVADEVTFQMGKGAFSASMEGTVAYRAGGKLNDQLVWLSRTGKMIRSLLPPDPGGLFNPDVARDGRVLFQRGFEGGLDIWLSSGVRGELTRATDDKATEWCALWAPSGREYVFASNRTGVYDLYRKPIAGPEEVLLKSADMKVPNDWSRDGQFLLYRVQQATRSDLWVLPLTGGQAPRPFVETRFDEREGQFSPDGRWVAYQSDESGRYQIYLRPFPGGGEAIPLTADGGTQPRWRPDGRELFYLSPDERLMALPIELNARGRPRVLAPVHLFQTQISGGAVPAANRQQYAVSADGQQFLMSISQVDAAVASPITVVLNWKPGRNIAVTLK